jgi:uncharacterized repeat protein (TIGR03803 family)
MRSREQETTHDVRPRATLATGRWRSSGILSSAATGALALAITFALTVVASQAAQAQSFQVLYNFTGAGDGANPYSGVTMDKAGNLYGTAFGGGVAGNGTVYQLKHKGSGWVLNVLYSFTGGSDGYGPSQGVIFGPDGALYGTTSSGGQLGGPCDSVGCGTVFKLRPGPTACKTALCPWTKTALYAFQGGADGIGPFLGDLVFDPVANIYGTTCCGGSLGGNGTVFELTPSGSGWTESVLHSFGGSGDGVQPWNGVTLDNGGNLYGTTTNGGSSNAGMVFQLVRSMGWTEKSPYSFADGNDGGYPLSGLIFDQEGNLYGATTDGGTGGGGTVFVLTPSGGSWTYSVLSNLAGTPGGCGPEGNLVMDQAGSLYGTTMCDGAYGFGSVFKLTPTSQPPWTYTSLHDFTGGNDGGYPLGVNVILDTNGNLYGTSSGGGTSGQGVVWEITFP